MGPPWGSPNAGRSRVRLGAHRRSDGGFRMAFREVSVVEIREVLRLWLRGEGYRSIERLSGVNRKTVHRYVDAALEAGLSREDGEDRLGDELIGVVCEMVR